MHELEELSNKDNDNRPSDIVKNLFNETGLKFTEDDPVVLFQHALNSSLGKQKEQTQEFLEQAKKDLIQIGIHFADKTKSELDWANEYFVGNSELTLHNLQEHAQKLLDSIDDKNKELNFIITRLHGEQDKQMSELFAENFSKINKTYNEILNVQRKIDTAKQREIIMAGAGFIAGLVVCLLVAFLIK